MLEITQGSIISGIRNHRYPNCRCFGIVISARCDLANDKIYKIFYLTAVDVNEWFLTQVGYDLVLKKRVSGLINSLRSALEPLGFVWDIVSRFSKEEFETVLADKEYSIKASTQKTLASSFDNYLRCTLPTLTEEERRMLLKEEEKQMKSVFYEINSGSNSHFTYIPKKAYEQNSTGGLIVDHQELDYFTVEQAKYICYGEMDIKSNKLSEQQKSFFDKQFFLTEEPGFSVVYDTIDSPWIEYLMQRFSNTFIRIGVDNVSRNEIDQMVVSITQKREEKQ